MILPPLQEKVKQAAPPKTPLPPTQKSALVWLLIKAASLIESNTCHFFTPFGKFINP